MKPNYSVKGFFPRTIRLVWFRVRETEISKTLRCSNFKKERKWGKGERKIACDKSFINRRCFSSIYLIKFESRARIAVLKSKDVSKVLKDSMDIVSAVEEFNGYNSKDLSKVLKDSDNSTLNWKAKDGSVNQIDIEKLAAALPLNLAAVLLSPNDGDRDFAYVLRGVCLLNTLSDVATRHARLEQILLDDVKVLEQVMDLVFFTMIVLSHSYQGGNLDSAPIIRITLGACVLHLLSSSLTSQWNELAVVLLAHPKVERFVESAFGSLHENTRLFRQKLTELSSEIVADQSKLPDAMKVSYFLSQQCEASLQFLLSLCQQKLFRDRVLKNKELCKNGGILSLARTILRLRVPECFQHSSEIIASVSRFKAKILALLLLLCEAETISYLDEVAGSPKSMQLGQSVALEFLNMLKTAFRREESKHANAYKKKTNMNIPRGFLLINSLRLVDIFSDDSNFRFSFMTTTVPFMSEILATPHEDFVSSWCSVNLPTIEEEANLEYDVFNAVGFAATAMAGGAISEANFACQLSLSSMHAVTYAQLRTSCIVKIIANLHIFVPNICEEHERDLFVREFHNHLVQERPMSSAVEVCKNLSSLAEYVKTLIPSLINQDDVQLLRVFTDTLRGYCNLQGGESSTEQVGSGELAKVPKAENMYHTEQSLMNLAAAFNSKGMDIDPKPEPEKLDIDKATVTRENTKESDPNEDERIEASNANSQDQRKKRKRNIMNDVQIKLIERALLDEPEMQRNAAALQAWADTLSNKGSEITPSQLKNWLNNRKARLARVAKETRHTSEGENPDSPNEDQPNMPSNSKSVNQSKPEPKPFISKLDQLVYEPGMIVSILDRDRNEVGTGKVFQVEGRWQGKSLADAGLCVVDVTNLKVESSKEVLNPSEVTGRTFEEAVTQNGGIMRVAWDTEKLVPLLNFIEV